MVKPSSGKEIKPPRTTRTRTGWKGPKHEKGVAPPDPDHNGQEPHPKESTVIFDSGQDMEKDMSDLPCISPEFNFDPTTGLPIREQFTPNTFPPFPADLLMRDSNAGLHLSSGITTPVYGLIRPDEQGAGFQTSSQQLFGDRADSWHPRNTFPETHGRSAITPAWRGGTVFPPAPGCPPTCRADKTDAPSCPCPGPSAPN